MIDTTVTYPGVVALADRLREPGIALGVCTNKEESFANGIIDGLGLRDRFAVVVGGKPGREPKPSPLPLLETIAALGGLPQSAIMIGDSAVDLHCAKNADVTFVGVSFGYSRVPLTNLGARIVIDRYADFEKACDSLFVEG